MVIFKDHNVHSISIPLMNSTDSIIDWSNSIRYWQLLVITKIPVTRIRQVNKDGHSSGTQMSSKHTHTHIYLFIYLFIYFDNVLCYIHKDIMLDIYIYIYIYIERERERDYFYTSQSPFLFTVSCFKYCYQTLIILFDIYLYFWDEV